MQTNVCILFWPFWKVSHMLLEKLKIKIKSAFLELVACWCIGSSWSNFIVHIIIVRIYEKTNLKAVHSAFSETEVLDIGYR